MRKTKYQPLADYLLASGKDDLMLTFTQIEEILGFELSPSARKHRANWSNNEIEALSWGWRNAGYESYGVDMNREIAHFRKVSEVNPDEQVYKAPRSHYPYWERPVSYRVNGEKVNIAEHVSKFIEVYESDPNGRYLSYDHIRKAFLEYRKDESKRDLLTLYLYSYLASWGMLRNSFLMQKDYKFSQPVVDILCKDKYDCLLDYNPFTDEGQANARLIVELAREITSYYIGQTYFEEGSRRLIKIDSVSDTLVTKILLGTFGCSVAYDTYVKKGLSHHQLTQRLSVTSVLELRSFAKANEDEIKEILSKLNNLYTPIKIIDMYFFEEGFTL